LPNYPTVLFYQILRGAQITATTSEEHTGPRREACVQAYGDGIVGGRTGGYTRATYYPLVCAQGALFFEALRRQMGNEAFFRGLQSYCVDCKYRVATPESLRSAMEKGHGQPLGEFFQRWVSTAQGT
jgi:hypothetical protein